MNDAGTILEVRDLCKSFDSKLILDGVNLEVKRGEVLAIIGSSGSGKSTLLRCLNFLEVPDSGNILHHGKQTDYENWTNSQFAIHRRNFGMIFQHFNLFGHKTALENVVEGLVVVKRQSRIQAEIKGRELLAEVGLTGFEDAYEQTLSGGQKQRVAIARALAMEPEILLMDEVTSALDVEMVGEVDRILVDLVGRGHTMIVVSHDLHFVRRVSTHIIYLEEGVVQESGATENIFENPKSENLKGFLRLYERDLQG